ncbi:hypothetical protein NLO72_01695 [Pseudomonas tremae]|uniref:hypothetical protein n=1 Tax=Pseudomonas tremae TaxID=200454 RepID=UPI00210A7D48|nr:hypothetical protein [Pseudomonas tremae]MCQ2987950.1 hypothetical protein [Pseudomonas tremae]
MAKKGNSRPSIPDIRMARPIVYHVKLAKKFITVQRSEMFDIFGVEINFPTPNNVSLFANIANKERQQAKNIHSSLIMRDVKDKRFIDIRDEDVKRLYNYLEHIQTSILTIYTAVESFANIAIPNEHVYTFKNSKGIVESYDKAAIERWLKTSEKIADLLPSILSSEPPKGQPFWSRFKELESIRNDIVHQKTEKQTHSRDINSSFLGKLLNPDIFDVVDSGFKLISFFCEKDIYHSFFPMGFSAAELKPIEIDDFEDQFTLYRTAEEKAQRKKGG